VTRGFSAALAVLACAAAPLFAPQSWAQHGAFPDVAALAVIHLANRGTPERAAVLGVAIGLVRSLWTPEPLGLEAALYGTLGWSAAHFGRAVFQERLSTRMTAAACGVLGVRIVEALVLWMTTPDAPDTHGMAATTWLAATFWAALATALAAPFVFGAFAATRAFSAFETRRLRDV
jgi:rod shape-determining protein MreD